MTTGCRWCALARSSRRRVGVIAVIATFYPASHRGAVPLPLAPAFASRFLARSFRWRRPRLVLRLGCGRMVIADHGLDGTHLEYGAFPATDGKRNGAEGHARSP